MVVVPAIVTVEAASVTEETVEATAVATEVTVAVAAWEELVELIVEELASVLWEVADEADELEVETPGWFC